MHIHSMTIYKYVATYYISSYTYNVKNIHMYTHTCTTSMYIIILTSHKVLQNSLLAEMDMFVLKMAKT